MGPSLFSRLRWWLEDVRDASTFRLEGLRNRQDARVVVGALLLLAVLGLGGFATARALAGSSPTATTRRTVRVVTLRQKVRVRVHGHTVTRWRTRMAYAKPQTVMQTQTLHTANGIRVVTRPVTRYRVVYRKRLIKIHGKTRTVLRPVTNTHTLTNTQTQLVTVTRQLTNTQATTITEPTTVVETTTAVSTVTVPITVTVTVTVPTTTLP